ncbi:unnamed protein product [Paramecium sonneborni]|uniref:Uncharacterized protein n=1 Tax=Paramecium sonneborni TaxID=65129 RepID=A0A8S1QDI4_9CILI|nr:unnamed protein product [Paramecium sonneborni]
MGIKCLKCQDVEEQITTQSFVRTNLKEKSQEQQKNNRQKFLYDKLNKSQNSQFSPSKQQYECEWFPNICINAKNEFNIEGFEESWIQTNQNFLTSQNEQQKHRISQNSSAQTTPQQPFLLHVSQSIIRDKISQKYKNDQKHRNRTKSENIINRRECEEKKKYCKNIKHEIKREKKRILHPSKEKQVTQLKLQQKQQNLTILINGHCEFKSQASPSQIQHRSKTMSPTPKKNQFLII